MSEARGRDGAPIEELVRHLAPEGSPSGCPDELDLAALAEGRLDDDERRPLEAHVAGCEACRRIVALLAAEEAGGEPLAPKGTGLRLLLPLVAVAAALLALLLVAFGPRGVSGPPSTDDRLVAAAGRLAAERPELFSAFAPLDADERGNPESGILRGGPVLLSPVGRILSARPRFRWEPGRASDSYVVNVTITSDSSPVGSLWSATAAEAELAYPAGRDDLAPGSYLFEVIASGPLGEESALAAFEVVSEEERAAFREAERAITELVDSDVARLVRAHYALRLGLWGEAEAAVRSHLQGVPGDPVGRETLFHVLSRLGASEADAFRPEKGE